MMSEYMAETHRPTDGDYKLAIFFQKFEDPGEQPNMGIH